MNDLSETTLYTTMEPCSKRLSGNDSCLSRILQAKIKRVVIGIYEPKNFVQDCNGVDQLIQAGVMVQVLPELSEACLKANQHLKPH
jgi:pyrimidine deaminase RibD-like protein